MAFSGAQAIRFENQRLTAMDSVLHNTIFSIMTMAIQVGF